MNYQSRASKQKSLYARIFRIGFFAVGLYVLGALLFPKIFNTLGSLLYVKDGLLSNMQIIFSQKKDIIDENLFLQSQLDARTAQEQTALANQKLLLELYKNVNTAEKAIVTTEVLMRPPSATYDTYIIAAGSGAGVQKDQLVTASGVYVLGYVDAVTADYARVRLFTSAGHRQTISIDGFLFQSSGNGGGVISTKLPRSFAETLGQIVRLPGASNVILGIVTTTEFDPQDSFVTGIVTPGVNLYNQEIVTVLQQKWVDIEALDLEQFNNTDDEQNTDTL